MEPLARALAVAGFPTLNLPYSSTRLPIASLVARVRTEVEKIAGEGPVHFITHSLGGIIVRHMMAEATPWKTGRIVMLAPPNHGSEIVDWAGEGHRLIHRFLGPAGRDLGSDGVPCKLPALPTEVEAAVIMGRKPAIPFFQKLLESDNDGIVSASRGRLDGLRGFRVIDADHTFIQMHPEAIQLSVEFLKTGRWADEGSA